MKNKGIHFGISLFLALFLSLSPYISAGQKVTHTVKEGDSLWSICEQYYGDPYLWPELWEMNKFVTNPHWLKPGDVIKLLEYKETKPKPEKKIVKIEKQPLKKPMGVDVSSLANTNALGLLLKQKMKPWGRIFDFKAERIMLSKNDTAYVKMSRRGIKPGDKFTICSISDLINHPLTGRAFGYIHSFKGTLQITDVKKDYHVGIINESFRTIYKDDLLIPLHQVPSCVLLTPCQGTLRAHIVASKGALGLLGQYSVVYIDGGHNRGIRRGNIIEAIEERQSISDKQKEQKVALPPTIVGKILILEATENTSTGVVFWASKNFTNGLKIRPVTWHKRPRELDNLPACPVQ